MRWQESALQGSTNDRGTEPNQALVTEAIVGLALWAFGFLCIVVGISLIVVLLVWPNIMLGNTSGLQQRRYRIAYSIAGALLCLLGVLILLMLLRVGATS